MTASARPGGVPVLAVLSVPARAFLLGSVAISLVAIPFFEFQQRV